jgi:hypothetical protein
MEESTLNILPTIVGKMAMRARKIAPANVILPIVDSR